MAKVISIGNQSFESIREKDNFYVDKTNFIKEWWDNDDIVYLPGCEYEVKPSAKRQIVVFEPDENCIK